MKIQGLRGNAEFLGFFTGKVENDNIHVTCNIGCVKCFHLSTVEHYTKHQLIGDKLLVISNEHFFTTARRRISLLVE